MIPQAMSSSACTSSLSRSCVPTTARWSSERWTCLFRFTRCCQKHGVVSRRCVWQRSPEKGVRGPSVRLAAMFRRHQGGGVRFVWSCSHPLCVVSVVAGHWSSSRQISLHVTLCLLLRLLLKAKVCSHAHTRHWMGHSCENVPILNIPDFNVYM